MRYPKILTLKTDQSMINKLEDLAAAAGRNRSEYLRDVTQALASHPYLRQAVTEALPPTQG
jgi:hypothetical protein